MTYAENNFEALRDPDVWREHFPNFTPAELACSDGTPFPLTPESVAALHKLQSLRTHLNFAFRINSAFRSLAYNAKIGGASDSYHIHGMAFDIGCHTTAAFRLVNAAPQFGFLGIGIMQKGALGGRYVHIDTRDFQAIWSY